MTIKKKYRIAKTIYILNTSFLKHRKYESDRIRIEVLNFLTDCRTPQMDIFE